MDDPVRTTGNVKQYFKDIYLGVWTVLIGMKITFKHLFTPAVTIQYPDVKLKLPERTRNRLYVNIDDCIGCDQCSIACPVSCIDIETVKSMPTDDLGTTSGGQKKRLYVTKFIIDIAKCCYCGLCVPPCPTDCIYMTNVYEFSEYDRNNLLFHYEALDEKAIAEVRERTAGYEKEQAAKKAAAAAQVNTPPPAPNTPPPKGS